MIAESAEPRTARNFEEAQALSSRRLGFAVTAACPLRCRHCSVSAGPDLSHTTFGSEFAARVAAQMPDLAAADVRFIDFTGGEPTLARGFVRRVGSAARAHGMVTGIVTAAHWATSEEGVRRTLAEFDCIDRWDISTDVYHTEFVPLERVRRAFDALQAAGRQPLLRIAHHEPLTVEDARLIEAVHAFAGRRMAFQPIGPVGRGKFVALATPAERQGVDRSPCPTTGLLIRSDGRGAPCCAPLSHESSTHPLWLGDAFSEPLTLMLHRWRTHWLLQTIRLWGMSLPILWADDAGIDLRGLLRGRACDTCVGLLTEPRVARAAMERAGAMDHRVRVAAGLLREFGEPWADELLRLEARDRLSGEPAG